MKADALISSILGSPVSSLAPESPLHAIRGWDSLMMVSLVVRIEELIGRELTETELDGLRTVADIQQFVKEF